MKPHPVHFVMPDQVRLGYWNRHTACGLSVANTWNDTDKWDKVTCKKCLRKKPPIGEEE